MVLWSIDVGIARCLKAQQNHIRRWNRGAMIKPGATAKVFYFRSRVQHCMCKAMCWNVTVTVSLSEAIADCIQILFSDFSELSIRSYSVRSALTPPSTHDPVHHNHSRYEVVEHYHIQICMLQRR